MDNEEKVNEFMTITGVETERAKFYLESSGWQLDLALTSFYENGDEDIGSVETISDTAIETARQTPDPPPVPVPAPATAKPKPRANSRFATVQSMQAAQQQQNSSDEEEGQAFYAGGSRNSGQQILGPPKKRDIVSDMFKSVQEHGAEVVDPSHPTVDHRASFSGTGYRLGNTPEDTTTVTPPPKPKGPQTVVLKLWSDGFTLGNGPIRPYANPENREFLDFIKRGEIPQELTREANGAEVHLDLEDHRHDQYTASKTGSSRAFTGKGHTLGSPAPNVVVSEPPKPMDTTINSDKGNEQAAVVAIKVDDAAPCTNVQVRLSDGSRLSGRFNHSHTIADLRRYIIIARPQYEASSFSLMTSYPSRELTNLDETLVSAGLLNAAVMQRMK